MNTKEFAQPQMAILETGTDILCSSLIAPDAPNKPAGAPDHHPRSSVWD